MARYKLGASTIIYDTETTAHIPVDEDNVDYQRYLAWVDAGNTPDPADPPALVYDEDGRLRARTSTTNATPTELFRATLPTNTGFLAQLQVIGVDTGNGALYAIQGFVTLKRLGAGASIVGMNVPAPMRNVPQTDGWAVTATTNGNDFVITVTGAAGRNIAWSINGTYISFTPEGR